MQGRERATRENNRRAGIAIGYRPGDIGRRDVLRQKVLPYNFLEPGMREDISSAVPHITVSLRRIGFHQLKNQVAGSRVEEGWPLDSTGTFRDLVVQRHGADLWFVERWLSVEHLEDQHAQRVPVDTLVVTRLVDNLVGCPQGDQGHGYECER